MREKNIIVNKILIVVLLLYGFTFIISCGGSKNEDKNESKDNKMKEYCLEFVSEYKVIDKNENGMVQISIEAPDFAKVAKEILSENPEGIITVNRLKKTAEKHPDYKKEYIFWTETSNYDDIENGFIQEVSFDIMVEAISGVEYSDGWSEE